MNIRTKIIASALLAASTLPLVMASPVVAPTTDKKVESNAPLTFPATSSTSMKSDKTAGQPKNSLATNIDMDQLIGSNLRIGFVNQYDIGQSSQGLEANKLIENKYKELGEKLQKSGQQLAQVENDLKSKGSLMSKDAFELEQKKFVRLQNDHKSKMEEYELDLKSTVRQLTESVMKEFQQAVIEIAGEENYDAIIDMDGKVLFAKGQLNVTPRVVQKMNGRRSTKITTAQAKPAAAAKPMAAPAA